MAKVVRQGNGGGVASIRAKELVPGDVVEVSSVFSLSPASLHLSPSIPHIHLQTITLVLVFSINMRFLDNYPIYQIDDSWLR